MVVKGMLIHTPVLGEIETIKDALITIDDGGQISSVQRARHGSWIQLKSDGLLDGIESALV